MSSQSADMTYRLDLVLAEHLPGAGTRLRFRSLAVLEAMLRETAGPSTLDQTLAELREQGLAGWADYIERRPVQCTGHTAAGDRCRSMVRRYGEDTCHQHRQTRPPARVGHLIPRDTAP